jgi:predicted RNA-binding protein YlxR (DUF448 family)
MRAKTKHVPKRTCLGCRQVKSKGELIRVVCCDGKLELDLTGKKPGRGVYMCPSVSCWTKALKGSRLDSAVRAQVAQSDRDGLLEYSKEF